MAERAPAGAARLPAAAAALFFALAPLNSQPVNYLWARSALLCTTLYLGAFLAFLRRRGLLGSTLFAVALLTKAIAVTLSAILLVHAFVYRDRDREPTLPSWLRGWRRLAPLLLLTRGLDVAYLGYRAAVWPIRERADAGASHPRGLVHDPVGRAQLLRPPLPLAGRTLGGRRLSIHDELLPATRWARCSSSSSGSPSRSAPGNATLR